MTRKQPDKQPNEKRSGAGLAQTTRDDVLILTTAATFRACIVGLVAEDGQQDFSGREGLSVTETPEEAIPAARRLLGSPPSRIWLRNLDSGDWRLVPS